MRQRELLLVHDIEIVKAFIKQQLSAELNDIKITETNDTAEALNLLKEQKFDIVMSAWELSGYTGCDVYESMKASKLNSNTAFLLTTAIKGDEHEKLLNRVGIKNFLRSPFTSSSLTSKINEICNPKHWRTESRYSIPDTKATLYIDNFNTEATVLNLSRSGMLCDLIYEEKFTGFLKASYMTVNMPSGFGNVKIHNILCKLLRVDVLEWHPNNTPSHIRTVWSFIQVSEEAKETLEQVLDQAERDKKSLI